VDINDAGVIAGTARIPGKYEVRLAVFWVSAGSSYRLVFLPPIDPRSKVNTEAVAIDGNGRILGVAQTYDTRFALWPNFIWSPNGGYRLLLAPGRVVDLNDDGQVAGNASLPYVFDLVTSTLAWTEIPAGFVAATVHAISPTGLLVGSLTHPSGQQVGAITDAGGSWAEVGGGSAEDHLFGINRFGDFVGHIRGLDPSSHCGVMFVEDGEIATLESYLFPKARSWRLFEVAGITDGRVLAAESVNDVTGLPGLIRLTPSRVPEPCGGTCIWVKSLVLSRPGIAEPHLGNDYVAEVQIDARGQTPPAKVEVTWVMNGGSFVRRASGESGPTGKVTFRIRVPYPDAEIYVTRLAADGRRFDATRGVLHASTSNRLR
jgi:hypothetical protein